METILPIKKADRTRQQLLDAALRIIGRKGYTAATVDEIVKEAGVSKGVAYYHFKNKAAIATNILDHELGAMIDQFKQVAEQSATARDALMGMLEAFATRLYDQRDFARFFMTEIWREGRVWSKEMHKQTQALVDVVAAQFARGQREGAVDADIDPTFEAVGVIGMVLTETMYYVGLEGKPLVGRDEFVKKIYDFARRSTTQGVSMQ